MKRWPVEVRKALRKLNVAAARQRTDRAQAKALDAGLCELLKHPSGLPARNKSLLLDEQPCDGYLLSGSRLYAKARRRYLLMGGTYSPALVSAQRSLSSPILLEPRIEYTPLASELIWQVRDPVASRRPERLLELRVQVVSLFHETNHRLLWKDLPPPPRGDSAGLRRYLNFAESLVIAMDMALGDEFGPDLSALFYLLGTTYDPGTTWRDEAPSKRHYLNLLHACAYATYLNLEFYDPAGIRQAIGALYPQLGSYWTQRVADRALRLDPGFLARTNRLWQKKHGKRAVEVLAKSRTGETPLVLSADPRDNRLNYLWAEKILGALV